MTIKEKWIIRNTPYGDLTIQAENKKQMIIQLKTRMELLANVIGDLAFFLETTHGYSHEMFFEDLNRKGLLKL